ncbi:hypothetical protein LCGC14_0893950 [marine sediment metagenome]|uniref:Uncharacterized protein n=1 Tax=marine sediment metagenome TaxID=412755 RepID=A0A0F9S5B6_9ZZZZ
MRNLLRFQIWRLKRTADGRGGFHRIRTFLATERGNTSLKSLTIRERGKADAEPGGQLVREVAHIGYFRHGADILKGDELRHLDAAGNVDKTFTVLSRRRPNLTAPKAEFEVDEIQKEGT